MPISARNQIKGTVTSITQGEATANVVLDANGLRLVASITVEAVKELGLRDLYQTPRVAPTVDFDHFIRGYNLNLPQLNAAGIIPIGPELDFWEPHGRERLGG